LSVAVGAHKRRRFLAFVLLIATVVGSITIFTTYYLLSSSNEVTQSTQVGNAFVAHLQNIESKNYSVVIKEYEENATVVWKGGSLWGLGGTWNTIHYFGALYSGLLSGDYIAPFKVQNLTYTVRVTGSSRALVNATFVISGIPPVCRWSTMVGAEVSYVHSGGSWLISNETWNVDPGGGCGGLPA